MAERALTLNYYGREVIIRSVQNDRREATSTDRQFQTVSTTVGRLSKFISGKLDYESRLVKAKQVDGGFVDKGSIILPPNTSLHIEIVGYPVPLQLIGMNVEEKVLYVGRETKPNQWSTFRLGQDRELTLVMTNHSRKVV